ncbi:DNA-3-methyladenine glycosylase I [Kineococcus sp. TBRC 1896]|uniref:DNA-3-methyladenine glycosylase I n=1 Tax=Kineococcus mangrovi TaxID=1660183 RepID=A0ABV4HX79_9ACTN
MPSTEPRPAPPPGGAPARCFGTGDALYEAYHDTEWGHPVRDDRGLFERISLEAFQSGLSWITVLRRRETFRAAFDDFDPARVAAYDDADVARLMADPGIIRNRAKVGATIANARALLELRAAGGSLAALFRSAAPETDTPAPVVPADVPSTTPGSVALAKSLKAAGFRFVGPTTAYAAMQACGVVDDHLRECPARAAAERARAASERVHP